MAIGEKRTSENEAAHRRRRTRFGGVLGLVGGVLALGLVRAEASTPAPPRKISQTFHGFIHDLPRTVRADHPAIQPVAAAIRTVTMKPLEQLVMVNDVTHLLVDYDDDARVYGRAEFYATLDEMVAKRRQQGWLYLRDDCDGRAVFAAHLLAALNIPWRLEASYWKKHAWVVARVDGVDYDLLDFRPDDPAAARLSFRLVGRWFVKPSHQPPYFDWRRRWAEQTHRDLVTGLQLGMLAVDSTAENLQERHSTDWAEERPGGARSPVDPRTLTAKAAGFPYGEALRLQALAGAGVTVPDNVIAIGGERSTLAAPLATNSSPNAGQPAATAR